MTMRMRSGVLTTAIALAACALAAPAGAADFGSTPAEQRAAGIAIGKDAFTYGYPLLDFNRTRAEALVANAPLNRLANAVKLATPAARSVVAPNVDTLYSLAQIDLGDGPVVLKVPKMGGRYWTFEIVEPYTNVVGYIGRRLNGSAGGSWALEWSGAKKVALGKGVKRFKSPSRRLWVIGRTLVKGGADTVKAKRLMAQYRLGKLADVVGNKAAAKPVPLDGARAKLPPPCTAGYRGGLDFIRDLNAALAVDRPPARDAAMTARLATAGVGAGLNPTSAGLPAAVVEGLEAGVDEAACALSLNSKLGILAQAKANRGWYDAPNTIGDYGTDYTFRARVALVGLGANTRIESTYPVALTDPSGDLLNGANRYRMVFKRGQLPPTAGFWSLTMYDSDGYLVENSAKVYAIGDSHPPLLKKSDGSVVVAIQTAKPTEKNVNWLPAPTTGFRLNLRLYLPSKAILNRTWKPPPVTKLP